MPPRNRVVLKKPPRIVLQLPLYRVILSQLNRCNWPSWQDIFRLNVQYTIWNPKLALLGQPAIPNLCLLILASLFFNSSDCLHRLLICEENSKAGWESKLKQHKLMIKDFSWHTPSDVAPTNWAASSRFTLQEVYRPILLA